MQILESSILLKVLMECGSAVSGLEQDVRQGKGFLFQKYHELEGAQLLGFLGPSSFTPFGRPGRVTHATVDSA